MIEVKPTDRRLTPEPILDAVRSYLGGPIALDPCTEGDNPTRAIKFFTAAEDGIRQGWRATLDDLISTDMSWDMGVFVNPPFSDRAPWDERAIQVSKRYPVFVLGNCEASANYDRLNQHAIARCDLYKRLKCWDPTEGRSKDVGRLSAVWGLNVDFTEFVFHFGNLGLCYDLEQVRRDNT